MESRDRRRAKENRLKMSKFNLVNALCVHPGSSAMGTSFSPGGATTYMGTAQIKVLVKHFDLQPKQGRVLIE